MLTLLKVVLILLATAASLAFLYVLFRLATRPDKKKSPPSAIVKDVDDVEEALRNNTPVIGPIQQAVISSGLNPKNIFKVPYPAAGLYKEDYPITDPQIIEIFGVPEMWGLDRRIHRTVVCHKGLDADYPSYYRDLKGQFVKKELVERLAKVRRGLPDEYVVLHYQVYHIIDKIN